VVTNEDGTMIELLDYYPYGTERLSWSSTSDDGEADTQKTYIGEYSDEETSLSYLNARYYDPQRGQFLSQDAVYLSLGSGTDNREQIALLDPQSQNSYSYARDNPITLKDVKGDFAFLAPLVAGFLSALPEIIASTSVALTGVGIHFLSQDIDTLQTSDTSGIEKGLAGFDAAASFGGLAIIGAVTDVGKAVISAERTQTIYRGVSKAGETIYIGRTNNFLRRSGEHLRNSGMRIRPVEGLDSVPNSAARGLEQTLIDYFGLSKNGGSLRNQINSIAEQNPNRGQLMDTARQFLTDTGLDIFNNAK